MQILATHLNERDPVPGCKRECYNSAAQVLRVLSKLFRRLMIDKLLAAHAAGRLTLYGAHAGLVTLRRSPPIWRRTRGRHGSSTPSANSRAKGGARLSVELGPLGDPP
jgi:hypothetical protein